MEWIPIHPHNNKIIIPIQNNFFEGIKFKAERDGQQTEYPPIPKPEVWPSSQQVPNLYKAPNQLTPTSTHTSAAQILWTQRFQVNLPRLNHESPSIYPALNTQHSYSPPSQQQHPGISSSKEDSTQEPSTPELPSRAKAYREREHKLLEEEGEEEWLLNKVEREGIMGLVGLAKWQKANHQDSLPLSFPFLSHEEPQ